MTDTGYELTMDNDCLGDAHGDRALKDRSAMERFLADVEARACRIASMSVRNDDDALDIVQDTMMRFVRSYANRPTDEWPPLFFRVLRNRIIDHQRAGTVRKRLFAWFRRTDDGDDAPDPLAGTPDPAMRSPEQQAGLDNAMTALEAAVAALPERQRQAFLLRAMEGLDVASTARAMDCSSGSVKQHYYRAVRSLRAALGDHWS